MYDLGAHAAVEVARGLVGQEDLRPAHDGPGDGDALLLASGELGGEVIDARAQPHAVNGFAGQRAPAPAEPPPVQQTGRLPPCHYGFEAFLCRVRDPDRKGKTERFLDFLEKDFVRGSEFSSFDELNERAAAWTDTIANRRVHGTTRLVPDEAWLEERDFHIRLPEAPFPVHRQEVRRVGPDATVSVAGTPYVIPERLADQSVAVRAYAEHFDIVDRGGNTAFSSRYKDGPDKGRLQLPPSGARPWIEASPERAGRSMDDAFLGRFPDLAPMLEGLKLRMKSLWHIHVRALLRLAALYGDEAFLQAAKLAQQHRRFNAEAVRRILERAHPIPPCQPPIPPVGADARALYQLTETDPASFEPYQYLDSAEPTRTDPVSAEPAPAGEHDPADPQSPEDAHET
jgi:hypothetical protein